jgi:hypothetical protein
MLCTAAPTCGSCGVASPPGSASWRATFRQSTSSRTSRCSARTTASPTSLCPPRRHVAHRWNRAAMYGHSLRSTGPIARARQGPVQFIHCIDGDTYFHALCGFAGCRCNLPVGDIRQVFPDVLNPRPFSDLYRVPWLGFPTGAWRSRTDKAANELHAGDDQASQGG